MTGLGEYLCEDDAHAIAMAREVMDKLRWDAVPPATAFGEPLFDEQELMGIVPADEREPYDVREVIARLVDGSDFLEFKAEYAPEMICGHARVQGHLVGANLCASLWRLAAVAQANPFNGLRWGRDRR